IYLALAVVFLLQAFALVFVAETVTRRTGALASLVAQFGLPAAARAPMLIAAPVLIAAWALAGFYASLIPTLTHTVFGFDPSLASGFAAFAFASSGAATVLMLSTRSPRTAMLYGPSALIVGTAAALSALHVPSPVGFFMATMLA